MQRFARLYAELDASTSTLHKLAALKDYFAQADAADAAWAVYFLCGGKPRQAVPTGLLRAAACEVAGIEDWLFEECYQAVGDLAETIAHLLPHGPTASMLYEKGHAGLNDWRALCAASGLAQWIELGLLPLREVEASEQALRLRHWWQQVDASERFLLSKLVGGGFRVGVSRLLVQRALAEHAELPVATVAQRMMGYTHARHRPTAERYRQLMESGGDARLEEGQPYPFFLAHALESGDEAVLVKDAGNAAQAEKLQSMLGPVQDWLVEWKYDGIRAQLVRRGERVWIWSRGEELLTERFPEVAALAQGLPEGTVLDGELLVWKEGRPAPFAELQPRINRKSLTRKLLADSPVSFIAYDLLEQGAQDLRSQPQHIRRAALESVLSQGPFNVSPLLQGSDWAALEEQRQTSRERGVEGLMIKHRDAAYGSGRRKQEGLVQGSWWKWKVAPMTVDAVLVHAQRGHGRRASVYTDYSFAVWSREPADEAEVQAVLRAIEAREPPQAGRLQLVSFAKAYSGLSDAEFAEVDRIIRATTLDKFGPVRSVLPSLVFELGFEGLQRSARHKSGIAVRFPRMLRIRRDKPLREADTLQTLQRLLGPA